MIAAMLSLISLTISAQQNMTDEVKLSKEEMAIKKVIEDETKYFFARDFDKWAIYWLLIHNTRSSTFVNSRLKVWLFNVFLLTTLINGVFGKEVPMLFAITVR